MTTVFKLSKPLKTHGGEVSELNLKTPRTRLMIKFGDPFKVVPHINDAGETVRYEFVWDNKSMIEFASDMTGVDPLALEALSVADFMNLREAIKNVIFEVVPDRNPSEQSAS